MSNNNPRQAQNGESALSGGMGAPDFAEPESNLKSLHKASDILMVDGLTKDHLGGLELAELQDSTTSMNSDHLIKDVWLSNFFTCMDHISKLVDTYNYISMDTEYPGTVYVPPNTGGEFEYQMIKANCDHLRLIQVGISLSNEHGEMPRGKQLAWQFNLQFEENKEQSMSESMELLRQSGFEFERHKNEGIPHQLFAEYLITSGLVLNRKNHWITFHGGVDFGYLLRQLQGQHLPMLQDDYLKALDTYFVNYYDCKEVKRELDLSGGLKTVAKELDVDRIGTMHQAGSDAFVTGGVYFKLRSKLRQIWQIDSESKIEEKIKGKIYGIGDSFYDDTHYIEQYKLDAQQVQYIDSTGYVNLRLKKQGYNATSTSANNGQHGTSSAQANTGYTHSNSAHGMLGTGGVGMSSLNQTGHHSSMDIHNHSNQRAGNWVSNNSGMIGGHGMVPGNTMGMNQMNHGHGSANTPVDMPQQYNSYNNMMHQGAALDINGINQNSLIHMNLGSFTPNNLGVPMGQNQSASHNLSASPSMHMFLQQQQQLMNSNNIPASMDENEMINQNQQYNRMMQMSSHPSQNQMQYGQQQQSNSYNNFGYTQPYHQQLLEASANTGYGATQHLSSTSPSMMANPMLHHNMSSHQMQQMQQQQHSYYIPPSNQNGYNN